MLPINVQPGQTHQMTEYEKRMKRAARFNIDPSTVNGPQALTTDASASQEPESMEVDQAFDHMACATGAPKIDKIQEQIDRIKKR